MVFDNIEFLLYDPNMMEKINKNMMVALATLTQKHHTKRTTTAASLIQLRHQQFEISLD